ncbi:hypothetical protein K438DRAFT_1937294 [Mycena galopus ATCC 62051]|nr:hypothetical protein K438DRAFT_1937294 [Mycena galopus ATCC 62051]
MHQIFGHHDSDALVANNTSLHLNNDPSPRLTGQRAPRYSATSEAGLHRSSVISRLQDCRTAAGCARLPLSVLFNSIAVALGSMIVGYLSTLFSGFSLIPAVVDGPGLEPVVQDMMTFLGPISL